MAIDYRLIRYLDRCAIRQKTAVCAAAVYSGFDWFEVAGLALVFGPICRLGERRMLSGWRRAANRLFGWNVCLLDQYLCNC